MEQIITQTAPKVPGGASYNWGDGIVDGHVEFQRFSCEFGQLY